MAYSTKFSKEDVKNIGIRLHAARVLTGMNREEFGEKQKIPSMSIKNWELGRVLPRQDAVFSIVDAFKNSGVFVSHEWVLYGSGAGPNYVETATFEKEENIDELLAAQINLFKKAQRAKGFNPVVIMVSNTSMAPTYLKGDVLGGVIVSQELARKEISANTSSLKPWLVTMVDGEFIPAFLYVKANLWLINTTADQELRDCPFPVIVKIKWHYCAGEQI